MRYKKRIALVSLISLTGCAQTKQRFSSDFHPPIRETSALTSLQEVPETDNSSVFNSSQDVGNIHQVSFLQAPEELPSYSIEEFEQLALSNNPTIAALVATTQKAAGYRTQVSLRANPTLGYDATQLADASTDQHTAFISQTIITADKLALNRRVLNEALRAQLFFLESQKYRVATDVRIKFFQALASQKQIALIREFQDVANKGVDLANARKQGQEGSQLEVVQANVQKYEIDLALEQAEATYFALWRELVALAGCPNLPPATLIGELPETADPQDWNALATSLLIGSPEYRAANTKVMQAQANLRRQTVQAVPNVDVVFGAGADRGTNSGLMNLTIGAPIPVFNKNQGNITAARAELARASQEVERIENSLKARLASASREFDTSLVAVNKFSSQIIPNANEGLRLAEIAYKSGETSFIQVLLARRTYFDANLQYLTYRTQLAQAKSLIDGYVLTGGLDPIIDESGDDSLRGLTLGQQ